MEGVDCSDEGERVSEDIGENYYSIDSDIFSDTLDIDNSEQEDDNTEFYDTIETEESEENVFWIFKDAEVWVGSCSDIKEENLEKSRPLGYVPWYWYTQPCFVLGCSAICILVLIVLWIFMGMK